MKQFVKYHLAWIRKKLRYPTGNGMSYFEFDIIVEVIRYYVPLLLVLTTTFLKNVRKSIMQMRSMRTAYMQPFGAIFFTYFFRAFW